MGTSLNEVLDDAITKSLDNVGETCFDFKEHHGYKLGVDLVEFVRQIRQSPRHSAAMDLAALLLGDGECDDDKLMFNIIYLLGGIYGDICIVVGEGSMFKKYGNLGKGLTLIFKEEEV